MTEDILKKVEQTRLDRRGFLRGSALAVAAFAGVAAASALTGSAQQPSPPQQPEKKDPPKGGENGGDSGESKEKLDAQGREYRVCPQCGYNMYREGRTWTCENCGYSYVE
jgi:hypothetical protein